MRDVVATSEPLRLMERTRSLLVGRFGVITRMAERASTPRVAGCADVRRIRSGRKKIEAFTSLDLRAPLRGAILQWPKGSRSG